MLFVLLFFGGCLWQQVLCEKCNFRLAIAAFSNYGDKFQFVVDTYTEASKIKSRFESVENRLAQRCDQVTDHKKTGTVMKGILKVVSLYKPMKAFTTPFERMIDKLLDTVLSSKVETLCDKVKDIRKKS
eukprot:TRINITY_DN29621_c0_g1_i1.p2 TRINITY_DN29621_c0_g1~~TRINITY_DN29621_c0_g1_i1.p2  ORF type:complete len:129 (-),score=10.32 TRINITY_DN29621_c0_g1_i1:148-534(-)